ncbi:MAG: hypothetical protein J5819_02770 [Eubacterium sp.]|nr:hypothetical protein [Eubacterium sp.]
MKYFFVRNIIIAKRLMKGPFFWICMSLLLILPIALKNEIEKHGVGVHVLILDESGENVSAELTDSLISVGNSVISFKIWNGTESEMRDRIAGGHAQAGYIIPSDIAERVRSYHNEKTPLLTAIRSDREISVRVIDEVVYGKLYDLYAESIAQDFTSKLDGRDDPARTPFIHDRYTGYLNAEIPFLFTHADGSVFTEFQNEDDRSVAVQPLKGLIALLVVLMSLSGGILWYQDEKRGVFMRFGLAEKNLVHLSYIVIPTLAAAITGLVTNMLLVNGSFPKEALTMLLLVIIQVPVAFLLQKLVRSVYLYMALIPVIIVCYLIVGLAFFEKDLHF